MHLAQDLLTILTATMSLEMINMYTPRSPTSSHFPTTSWQWCSWPTFGFFNRTASTFGVANLHFLFGAEELHSQHWNDLRHVISWKRRCLLHLLKGIAEACTQDEAHKSGCVVHTHTRPLPW